MDKKNIIITCLFCAVLISVFWGKFNFPDLNQAKLNHPQVDIGVIQSKQIMQQLVLLKQSLKHIDKRINQLENNAQLISSQKRDLKSGIDNKAMQSDKDSIQAYMLDAEVNSKAMNDQRIQAFQQQLEEEPVSSEWAIKSEEKIRAVISTFSSYSDTSIECKSSICRLEFYFERINEASAVLQKLSLHTGHILPLMNTQYSNEDELIKVIVFLSERNES